MKIWDWNTIRRLGLPVSHPQLAGEFPLSVTIDTFGSQNEPHAHIFYETLYVAAGKVDNVLFQSGAEIVHHLSAGDVMTIVPQQVHDFRNAVECKIYNLLYTPEVMQFCFEELLRLPGFKTMLPPSSLPLHVAYSSQTQLQRILDEIARELYRKGIGYTIKCRALLANALVEIGRAPQKGSQDDIELATPITSAINFMENNLHRPLRLADIVNVARLEKTYFCHLFKKETRMSPWQYLIKLRIEHANFMFQTLNVTSNTKIAYACGFDNSSYFGKVYKKVMGCTPNEYRKRLKHQ